MSLKAKYIQAKGGLKRRLFMSSDSASSTPPSNLTQSNPDLVDSRRDSQSSWMLGSASVASDTRMVEPTGSTPEVHEVAPWSGLQILLNVLNSALDVFPPLKLALYGLNECIEIFERAAKGRKEYDELRTVLDSLLRDLSHYIGNDSSLEISSSINNLCIGLAVEVKMIQESHNRSAIRRHTRVGDDSEEVFACYRRVQGYLERLMLNVNLSMWETVNEVATEARLRALSPVLAAAYNSAESDDVKRRACTPGTRERELIKLLSWVRDETSGTEGVYWMNGMAGTGKTTIAYSLCAELEQSSNLGASFFCSRLIPQCRDVKLIIPSIAYQLARFSRPFRFCLSAILKANPDVNALALRAQFENLLFKPLASAKHALPTNLVIVIDALDECDNEESVGQILDVLLFYSAKPELPVRFLVSSRPEPEIYHRMMRLVGNDLKARLVLHDLDAQLVKYDIEAYFRAELAIVGLTPSQLAALVQVSGVLFIFASTAARYIKEGLRYMDHEERLDTILGLSSAPTDSKDKEIDKLYTSILGAVFLNNKAGEKIQTRIKIILDTIICAQESMTIDGLAGLLGEKRKQVEALLRLLSSVLNISESSGLVTTLHASFPDYILDRSRSTSFYCDPAATHARILCQCLNAIRDLQPHFNICEHQSSYLRDDEASSLTKRLNDAVPPQVFYACRHWIAHMERGAEPDNARTLLWDFLAARLLLWIEIMNARHCMYLGPGIMQRAESWARINEVSKETIELVHDAWRFVTMFAGHAISQSTPHLYISMLLFWPKSSPITNHYFLHAQGALVSYDTASGRRQPGLLATWKFEDTIYSPRFSPDRSLIAFGTSSRVYVINAITGKPVLDPLAHDAPVRSVAFSPDGTLLACGADDNNVRVWRTTNGELAMMLSTGIFSAIVPVCVFANYTRIVICVHKAIQIWDLENGGKLIRRIDAQDGWVLSICVSPDGTRIASSSDDYMIRVWDLDSGDMVFGPLQGHTDMIWSLGFSPDGTRIVSGSNDKTIRVWSIVCRDVPVDILQGHTNHVNSVAFSPNGKQIVSGSRDRTVRIWNTNTGTSSSRILQGHMEAVTSVAFSSDGSHIVSGSYDHTVRVWDPVVKGPTESALDGHTGQISSVEFSPDGLRIVSGSDDTTIRVWDTDSGKVILDPLRGHTHWVNSVSFSPDGTHIASGSADTTIRLWNAQSGHSIGEPLVGHSGAVRSVRFSHDGTLLASGSEDNTIWLWDPSSHHPVTSPLQEHEGWVQSLCFMPNTSRLVSSSYDKTLLVWNIDGPRRVFPPLTGHTCAIGAVCASPDGTRVASGSADKTVRLWDARVGQPLLAPLRGHTGPVTAVSFSPNGRCVVSGSTDRSLRLWDAETGKAIGSPLTGHSDIIRSCDFSPNGSYIASGSNDMTIRIWDVADLVNVQILNDIPSPATTSIIESSSGTQSWVLQEDGWVVDSQSRLLVWVPPDLHSALMGPRNVRLISTGGSFQLDFDFAKLGESWTECYRR